MIRAGFIGTGGISPVHLRYLKTRPDVRITALCDINDENLKKRQAEYGGNAYHDLHEMLGKEDLDAVWVCTPPQVREEPLVACARKGIPVFCEKPVERDVDRGDRIDAQLRKRKAHVQIGYVFRSMPVIERLRKEMADDRIHLVQSLYACDVSLKNSLPPWFYEKEKSGGALVDQATHNLDLLRMLMGEVRTVRGFAANPVHRKKKGYTIEEVFALSFLFENGSAGSHVHTWVGDTWRNEILLSGEKRVYRLNTGNNSLTVDDGNDRRIFGQDGGQNYEHQNKRFLAMVGSGNWSDNPSDYHDGLLTLKLTALCDAAVTKPA